MSLNRFTLLIWGGMLILHVYAMAQIQGKVVHYTSENPLMHARISVVGTGEVAVSDENGYFLIQSPVSPSTLLKVELNDYYTLMIGDLPGKMDSHGFLAVQMVPGDSDKILYYLINTIEVTADKNLKNSSIETRYVIDQGDVKHYQATNLGDLLDLIPGYIRRNRPGLKEPLRANIRGIFGLSRAEIAELYGTGLYMDGISFDNLMNGTTGEFVSTPHVSYDGNNGVDLRRIPVDGLQTIEVIPGLPSVEYGNLVSGMIRMKSRYDRVEPQMKFKTNPDTREFSLISFVDCVPVPTNISVNVASSDTDLRAKTDSWSRFNLHLNGKFGENNQRFQNKWTIFYSGITDKYRNPVFRDENYYHKNHRFVSALSGKYITGEHSYVDYHFDYTYDYRRTHENSPNSVAFRSISTRLTPGTQEPDTISGNFMALADVISKEYSGTFKINARKEWDTDLMTHGLMSGLEYRIGKNKGQGAVFNAFMPPRGLEGVRPYAFNSRPGFQLLSLWIQDDIKSLHGLPVEVRLGIRSDLYKFGSTRAVDLMDSGNRFYMNPRIGIKTEPAKWVQIRLSAGQTTKAPSLNYIYQKPVFIDTWEQGQTGSNPVDLVTTSVIDYANPGMKPIRQKVYELGMDFEPNSKIGVNLTGFYRYTDQIPVAVHKPFLEDIWFWDNWGNTDEKSLLSSQWQYEGNNFRWESEGWSLRRGLELSVRTFRFQAVNSRIRIGAAYVFSREGEHTNRDVENNQIATFPGDTVEVLPYYKSYSNWKKQLNLSATWDYLNEKWKLWLSATVYWQPLFKFRSVATSDSVYYAEGYFSGGSYQNLSRDEAMAAGLYRYISNDFKTVQKFPEYIYFNITVTKSIWRDLAISFYVNNIFNNRYYYYDAHHDYKAAAPEIFYGMQFTWNVSLAGGGK